MLTLTHRGFSRCSSLVLLFFMMIQPLAAGEINPYQAGMKALGRRDWPRALVHFDEAISLNLQTYNSRLGRGRAFHAMGKLRLALAEFEAAHKLRPKEAHPLRVHAEMLYEMHDYGEASREFQRLIILRPDEAGAHNDFAWALATCPDAEFRDGPHSRSEAKEAVRLSQGKSAYYLDTLAAAYAECGQFEDAIQTQSKASALVRQPGQDPQRHHGDFDQRLRQYRNHQPLRIEP